MVDAQEIVAEDSVYVWGNMPLEEPLGATLLLLSHFCFKNVSSSRVLP